MELDPIPSKGSILPILLIVGCLPIFGCTGTGHFFPPTPPENLKAVFTEDIFGTDGVRDRAGHGHHHYDHGEIRRGSVGPVAGLQLPVQRPIKLEH